MNGVHDLGGLQCFGKIKNKEVNVKFHEEWEKRLFASTLCSFGVLGPIDAFRHAIEQMDPVHYLSSSYYEHWLEAVESRIKHLDFSNSPKRKPLNPEDINKIVKAGADYSRDNKSQTAPINIGSKIRALPYSPPGHTRLPGYVKGKVGVIDKIRGVFVFPDTLAHGLGECEQPLYSVKFRSQDLWADSNTNDVVYIDLWQSYLEVCNV